MISNVIFAVVFTKEEILSRPLADVLHSDIRPIKTMSTTNDEFNIQVSIRRKSTGAMNVDCHFLPVICIGRRTTHFLITLDSMMPTTAPSPLPTEMPTVAEQEPMFQHQVSFSSQNSLSSKFNQAISEPRGSIYSMRRGSFDVRSIASENIRRTSLAKLSALPLEAPITKVSVHEL